MSNSDIVRAYLGLLVQGKSDFDAIEGYRGDKFFKEALGVGLLASNPTLRQLLDAQAAAMFEHIPGISERLLASQRPDYRVLACGWLPLDVDTFAMNNGGIAKEGVGRTYAGTPADPPEAADDPAPPHPHQRRRRQRPAQLDAVAVGSSANHAARKTPAHPGRQGAGVS